MAQREVIRVLVAFHFDPAPYGELPWKTDVLQVTLPCTYEQFVHQVLNLQAGLSHFFGQSWTGSVPFHVMWFSQDQHGKIKDMNDGVIPFQTYLRKANWEAVLRLMQRRGCRDVIRVGITNHKKYENRTAGMDIEREEIMRFVEGVGDQEDGNMSMTTVADSD